MQKFHLCWLRRPTLKEHFAFPSDVQRPGYEGRDIFGNYFEWEQENVRQFRGETPLRHARVSW